MITIIEYGQNLVKLLYCNSFVAIKILLHYDCFNKNSGCLHTTPFTDNFDSICVFLPGYELFRTGSCSFEFVAGGLGGCRYFWEGGCGWFQVVSAGLLFQQLRIISMDLSNITLIIINIINFISIWLTKQYNVKKHQDY